MKRLIAVAALALVLAGCGPTAPGPDQASESVPPSLGQRAEVVPLGIRVPAIGLDNRQFMQVGLAGDGTLEVPPLSQPQLIGWFRYSPVPGDTGPAVLAAHVNANGHPGAFTSLAKVKAGDTVEVDRSDRRTAVFTVTKVDILRKVEFPTQAVYGDTPNPQLRLITCGPGALQTLPNGRRSYVNQTIVYAALKELRPTR